MKRKYTRWTFENIIEEARKYQTRTAFCRGSYRAYMAAKDSGMLDHLFPVVRIITKGKQIPVIEHRIIYKAAPKRIELSREDRDYITRDVMEMMDSKIGVELKIELASARKHYAQEGEHHLAWFDEEVIRLTNSTIK